MKYRVVQNVEGKFIVSNIEEENFLAWCEARGLEPQGFDSNRCHRAELQGQPIFGSMLGPMWDGDAIRYEDKASYDHLSI